MTRLVLFILVLFAAVKTQAQLTLRLTSVPANTPAGAYIHLAGNFNTWNPGLAPYRLSQNGGTYTITLPTTVRGAIEFKYTRGAWASVETNATGGALANRQYNIPATGTDTLTTSVAGWEDLFAPATTASPSVSIISTSFAMPQLGGRTRRIWLYLPPDYAISTKTYPVLYMHDGQNLFDAATAFSGEWGVDETLDQLQAQGDWGCIVIGIDNGGANRLNEYSPYVNRQYGGGEGDEYVDFIISTLKPYVDQRYRTRQDRLSTGIMGSSMGGLISLYAALKRPDVFGRAGVFSPSLWFNRTIYTYARTRTPQRPDPRFYMLSGGRESQTQLRDQRQMVDTLALAGFTTGNEVDTNTRADGQHAEWFWKREFAGAYSYLFAGTATSIEKKAEKAPFEVYPNPGPDSNGMIIVKLADPKSALVEILDAQGRVVKTAKAKKGKAEINVRGLGVGKYQIRVNNSSVGWIKQ